MAELFTGPEEEVRLLRERALGRARTGDVVLADYIVGLIVSLGGRIGTLTKNPNDKYYFVQVSGIDLSNLGVPGVPVNQSYPEDVFNEYQVPVMFFRFDGFDAALERQHSGHIAYVTDDPASPEIPDSGGRRERMLVRGQDAQYDLNFTLVVEARNRIYAGLLLRHALSIFQPHSSVWVKDSIGDIREYYCGCSSGAPEDEIFDIADRTMGFSLPLRVMGELSTIPEFSVPRVVGLPRIGITPK